jgi:hypothetical protein
MIFFYSWVFSRDFKISKFWVWGAWIRDIVETIFVKIRDRRTFFFAFTCHKLEYEGLVSTKMKSFFRWFLFISYFLWINNMIWAITKIPSVTRRCRYRCDTKFRSPLQPVLWKLESWSFGSRSLLGQLDVPYAQNFEIRHL